MLLAAGGTVAMRGQPAQPALGAEDLLEAVPGARELADVEPRTASSLPGVHVGLDDALRIARAATEAAAEADGVVVTHGTDTLEETAYLCDLLHGGEAPIVVTGAMRPASAPGADGPANVLGAVAVAASPEARGLGAVVVFAGEVHAARAVRKVDSTGPAAFASPRTGPLGRVAEGAVRIDVRPPRAAPLDPRALDARVDVVPAGLGTDGAQLRTAVEAGADGVVVVTLGAGHVPPSFLAAIRDAATRVPVVATVRPERGSILHATYGFEGAEGDLRASGAIPAGALSPAAARIKLLACLGAGLDRAGIAAAFAPDDG